MWQPIETAPKGGGAEMVTDPKWVEPPDVLLFCSDGTQCVAYWDWYYAEGGRGYTDGNAWIIRGGERVYDVAGEATHWMLLPPPPMQEG